MANVSTVNGQYEFDFSNVKMSDEQKIAWVKELNEILSTGVAYSTYLNDADDLTVESIKGGKIFSSFDGDGRWTYSNNIKWFVQGWPELSEHLAKADGLKMEICYKEYEPGCSFVSEGTVKLDVNNGFVKMTEEDITSDDLTPENFVDYGKPRTNTHKRVSNVWCDITEASQSSIERCFHPTVKAQKLCDRLITTHSNENDLVFIPFVGSGSEIISAVKNNRRVIGCEIDKDYYIQATNRIDSFIVNF